MPNLVAYSIIIASISMGTRDVASSKTAYWENLGFTEISQNRANLGIVVEQPRPSNFLLVSAA